MIDLGIEELPPGRYAGMVEKVRYTFTATTRIFITYRLDMPDGTRRLGRHPRTLDERERS